MLLFLSCVAVAMLLIFTVIYTYLSNLHQKQKERGWESFQLETEPPITVDLESAITDSAGNTIYGSVREIEQISPCKHFLWTIVLQPSRPSSEILNGDDYLFDIETAETAC